MKQNTGGQGRVERAKAFHWPAHLRAAVLMAAATGLALPATRSARAGDVYYYNVAPPSTAYWNTAGQPYSAWYDQTTNTSAGIAMPAAGGTANLLSSGTIGVSGLNVFFNAYYGTGTAGLLGVFVDSGNTITQNAGTTRLSASGQPAVPFGPPGTYGHEYIGFNGSGSYVQSAGTNYADYLQLGGATGGSGTYALSGGLLQSPQLFVGDLGSGTLTHSGGTILAGQLLVGSSTGSIGSYSLSAAGVLYAGLLSIGDAGSGTFQQTGGSILSGTNDSNSIIVVGRRAGGSGSWILSSGTVNLSGSITVGGAGSGTFTMSGGSISLQGGPNLGGGPTGALSVGSSGSSAASMTMTGGSITAQGGEAIGYQGVGTFQQSAGVNQPQNFAIGAGLGDNGTATLSGGLLLVATQSQVGLHGNGTLFQSGGTHSTGLLSLGTYGATGTFTAGTGSYTLSGQSVFQTGDERIGDAGIGTFLQTGGTHVIGANGTGSLYIGFSTASQGVLTFSGGSFTPPRNVYVGYSGNGTLTQTTGTLTFQVPAGSSNGVFLGFNPNSTGVVNLSGTSSLFQVLSGGPEYVGYNGAGTFNQQSGTHVVSGDLLVAYNTFSSGTYNLSGGTLNVAGSVNLGSAGAASFNQTGGVFTASGSMTLGASIGSATYTLSNNASLSVGGSETLGGNSAAVTFNQYGGAHSVAGSLTTGGFVLTSTNAAPLYNLYGGTLAVTGQLKVHSFQQSGGTVSAGSLSVQQYGLSGGAFLHVLQNESVLGLLTQTGGTHQVDGTLNVGSNTAGSFTLGGADALLNVYGDENVGVNNTSGSLTQSGGVNNVGTASHTASLNVGSPNGSLPGYQISDGQLNVSGNLTVTHGGAGVFTQSGGSVVVSGGGSGTVRGFIVGTSAQGPGRVTLSAGSLNAGPAEIVGDQNNGTWTQSGGTNLAGSIYVGYQNGSGTFTQSGGTCSTGSLTLGYFTTQGQLSSATAQYNLTDGLLNVSGNETLGAGASGTMTQSGGLHTIGGTLSLSSGFAKNGVLNLSGGSLTAASTANAGAINQSGGTSMLGAVSGSGTISLSATAGPSLMQVSSLNQASVKITGGLLQESASTSTPTDNVTSLSISGGGLLDLNNHNLLTSTAASSVRQYLTDGYNAGAWNGTAAAIVSSAAAQSSPTAPWTLGYATGGADASTAAIPAGQTLVKYTIPGDADLSGSVDFNDFLSLQNGYNATGDWAAGDFNYDGVVNYQDYLILLANYGRTPTGFNPSAGAAPYIAPPTPEPATLALLALGATAALSRRRRRPTN